MLPLVSTAEPSYKRLLGNIVYNNFVRSRQSLRFSLRDKQRETLVDETKRVMREMMEGIGRHFLEMMLWVVDLVICATPQASNSNFVDRICFIKFESLGS